MEPLSCPHCHHAFDLRGEGTCPDCGTFYRAADLNAISFLVTEIDRLEAWTARGLISPRQEEQLLREVRHELEIARNRTAAGPAGVVVVERAAPAPRTEAVATLPPTGKRVPLAQSPAVSPPGPAPESRPARTPFSWGQVGAYLLSERTLNGLLGLGAFLILAAGVVISTINPTKLATLPHLAATIATTVVLYASGYYVRQKLQLTKAGTALLGIGAAFVPLVVWTLGRDTALGWDGATIWLVASTLCVLIYLGTHLLLRDRTFAALTVIAFGSEVLAVAHRAGIPIEWGICAMVALAIAYLFLSVRVRDDWPVLSWALFWSAQIVTPLAMLALIAGKLSPDLWKVCTGQLPTPSFEYAVGGAWWLGVVFYLLTSRLFKRRAYEFAAAWIIPIAFLLTLTKAPWSASWYNVCLAALSAGYFVAERWLPAPPSDDRSNLPAYVMTRPAYQVALALVVAAASWLFATIWTASWTFAMLAVSLGAATILLRTRAWAYLAIIALLAAYGLTIEQLSVLSDNRPLAWALASLVLLLAAEVLVQRSGEARRGAVETVLGLGQWRSRFAAPSFIGSYLSVGFALGLAASRWWDAPSILGVRDLPVPVIAALFAVAGLLIASAVTRRTSFFLYPAACLLLVPITSTAYSIFHNAGFSPSEADWARLIAILGALYIIAAWAVDRARGHFAQPIYLIGYALSAVTMVVSAPYRVANVEIIGLSLLVYTWSAWRVHIDRHPSYTWVVDRLFPAPDSAVRGAARAIFLYLACWLFPIWLLLAVSLWRPAPEDAVYGLALALLAPVYVVLGRAFAHLERQYRWPWYLAGYTLSGLGPLLAAPDRTLFIAALAVSVGLYIGSAIVSRRATWLYLVAGLLPVLLWQSLDRAGIPWGYDGVGLVVLGVLYLGVGVLLHSGGLRGALQPIGPTVGVYARPFFFGSFGLGALGLALAALADLSLGLETAIGYLALLVVFSVVWQSEVAAFAGATLIAVTLQEGLSLAGVPPVHQPPVWAAAALLAALASFGLKFRSLGGLVSRAGVWSYPLYLGSMTAGGLALLASLFYERTIESRPSLEALALTTAITGLAVIAHGANRRERVLSYLGVAGLLVAGMLELAVFRVGQPQAFVLPAGIYLLAIAFLEWKRAPEQGDVKASLETAAITLLLGTSLLQAVGLLGAEAERYAYDTFLLVESTAMFALGASLHWKKLFFAGAAALITDVFIMLADPVRAMNTWYLVALIGFVMIGLVLLAEKRRREIPIWFDQWRQRMDSWA
jgi:hypothetical protein